MKTKRGANIYMLAIACAFCIPLSLPLWGQSADVSGTVRDTNGAVIPTASLKLTSQTTGTSLATQANGKGLYSFPNVQAGIYDLTVKAAGFQSEDRVGITINVAAHAQINFDLKVGAVNQSVTVSGTQESLDTADAVNGQTIDRTFINDLPLLSRSALDLAFLAPGVNQPPGFTYGQSASVVPYLTANNFSSDGSRNAASDVLIDGITTGETVTSGLNTFVSYTPSVDAVQEFKVQQSNFSAEYGFSGATITNVVTRSGTNTFHGSAFEFFRNNKLDANNYFNNQSGIKLPGLHQNIFGGTVGGPVFKNRTFFFFDYEGTRISSLSNAILGVPSAAEKQGDFGEVCTLQGGTFDSTGMCSNPNGQLWDPYTGTFTASAGGPVRSGIIPYNNIATYSSPGNPKLNGTGFQLTPGAGNLIDPVAQKLIQYYPDPNRFVGTSNYDRFNNWIGTGANTLNNDQWDLKIDQHFSDSDTLSAKYAHRSTLSQGMNCFGNLADPCTQGPFNSTAHIFSLDFTHIFGPATVLDFTYGLTRTARLLQSIKGIYPSIDPVKLLGMPSYIDTSGYLQLPAIHVNEGYTPGDSIGGDSIGTQTYSYLKDGQDTHDLLAALSHLQGRHELKFGVEFRMHRFNDGQPGSPAGIFNFDSFGTSQQPFAGGGDAMATFLIGTSVSAASWGRYEIPAFLSTQNFDWAGYAQDNFHASKNLTVNVGLRYDLTMPATERNNEQNWVDPNAPSPLQVPGLPPLKGGDVFASSQTRTILEPDYKNFQPRFGLAYSLNDKTVVRTGYGIYFDPSRAGASADVADNQGFDQTTPWINSYQNDQATPWGRLSDPFPNGVRLPVGSSEGLLTNVGFNAEGVERTQNATPYEQSWSLDIERSVPGGIVVDATYIGKKGTHLYFGVGGDYNLNHLGEQVLHYSPAQIAALNAQVPNPFYGIITDPTSGLSHPTVSETQLQMPYPQFESGSGGCFCILASPWANSIYHAFQLRVEKRLSNGLQFLVTYVWSKSIDDASLPGNGGSFLGGSTSGVLDPNNLSLERSLSEFNLPQVLQFSYVYQLPFGRGKSFGGGANPVVNGFIGGWQTNGIWRFDNGQPIIPGLAAGTPLPGGFGQRAQLTGAPRRNHGSTASVLKQYFANPQDFTIPAPYTLGNAPRTLSLNIPGTANATLSLFKEFPLSKVREGMRLEYRVESFNAFNHPQFCAPNASVGGGSFGTTTCQANSPREVQMALKLYF